MFATLMDAMPVLLVTAVFVAWLVFKRPERSVTQTEVTTPLMGYGLLAFWTVTALILAFKNTLVSVGFVPGAVTLVFLLALAGGSIYAAKHLKDNTLDSFWRKIYGGAFVALALLLIAGTFLPAGMVLGSAGVPRTLMWGAVIAGVTALYFFVFAPKSHLDDMVAVPETDNTVIDSTLHDRVFNRETVMVKEDDTQPIPVIQDEWAAYR